jgi:hypothetical protein
MKNLETHIRSIVDHDGAVILNFKCDQFYSTNLVGAYIWTRLRDGIGVDQIARELSDETGADLSAVLADVNEFLAELKDKHLFQFPA